MRLIVIHNAGAGAGHMSRAEAERLLRGAGYDVQIIDRKDYRWHDRLADGADAIVVAGGDGTVQKVIHDVAGTDVPVAILPIGTANNIAHSRGFTFGDRLEERVRAWPGAEQRIALGGAARDGWSAEFIESVGVGVFAEMVADADDGEKSDPTAMALVGVRRALIEKLIEAEPVAIEFEVDGERVAGEYLMAEVLNMRFVGPRLFFAPDQSPDRATFTVCAIEASQRDVAAHWIAAGTGDPRRFQIGRGRVVRMRTAEAMHVDGKGIADEPIGDIELEGGARTVRVWV